MFTFVYKYKQNLQRLLEGEGLQQKREVLALKICHCLEKYKYLKETSCHLLISS